VRTSRLAVFVGALLVASWGVAGAQEAAKPARQYVGVKKCKTCHNSAKSGGQFAKWTESKHSKAYAELASPKSKEIATKEGIADPQKSDKCLACHVTGKNDPSAQFAATFADSDGVQCETCHGAGSEYMKMATMKGLKEGTVKAEDVGLLKPDKDTCAKCHNEKGTGGKPVDWPADSTKIAHGIPADYKAGGEGAK
jgi:hypothetical protein